MTNNKNFSRIFGGIVLLAVASLFTCEKVPDYCRGGAGQQQLYDPAVQFCFEGEAYPLCNGMMYNPRTECCNDGLFLGTLCADSTCIQLNTPCGGFTMFNANSR